MRLAVATSAACRELTTTLRKSIPKNSSFSQRQLYAIFAQVGINPAVRLLLFFGEERFTKTMELAMRNLWNPEKFL